MERTNAIRAGRAYVELFTKDGRLVKGLPLQIPSAGSLLRLLARLVARRYNAPSHETLDILSGSHRGMDEPQAAGGHRVSQGGERPGGLLRSHCREAA